MKKRIYIEVYGDVQQQGFRYACRTKAINLGVCGYVRNRSGGQVEIEAEGEERVLKNLVDWCEHSAPGTVESVDYKWYDNKDEFTSFVSY